MADRSARHAETVPAVLGNLRAQHLDRLGGDTGGEMTRGGLLELTLTSADDIGPDYAPTLAAWRARFDAALPTITALGFDAAFVRAWHLYLAFSQAAFAERTLADHQLVLTRR